MAVAAKHSRWQGKKAHGKPIPPGPTALVNTSAVRRSQLVGAARQVRFEGAWIPERVVIPLRKV